MDGIDTHLFIEIIQSEDIRFLDQQIIDGKIVEYYHGRNGKRVAIWVSDEYLSKLAASTYLRQLGCEDLIPRLFGE